MTEHSDQERGLVIWPVRGTSKKDDAGFRVAADGKQFTEVRVDGHDASLVVASGGHDIAVGGAEKPEITDVDRVVAVSSEQSSDAS